MLTLVEYLKKSIEHKYLGRLRWHKSIFGIPTGDTEYIRRKDKKTYLLIGEDWVEATWVKHMEPVALYRTIVEVDSSLSRSIADKIETNVGNIIINYILIWRVVGEDTPFINGQIRLSSIEQKVYISNLVPGKEGGITLDKYKTGFVNGVSFIRQLVSLSVQSASAKAMLPPEGIDEFKRDLVIKYKKEYGEDCFTSFAVCVKFENELRAYDKAWMEKDPTYGVVYSGKIMDIARKDIFLTSGIKQGFKNPVDGANFLLDTLKDPKINGKEDFAIRANDIRSGSYSRGQETVEAGVMAKTLLRAVMGIKIIEADCGTKIGLQVKNLTSNAGAHLLGKSVLGPDGKWVKVLSDAGIKNLIGTSPIVRSPLYCLYGKNDNGIHFCKECIGNLGGESEHNVVKLIIKVGGSLLAMKLANMHGSVVKTHNITDTELFGL